MRESNLWAIITKGTRQKEQHVEEHERRQKIRIETFLAHQIK